MTADVTVPTTGAQLLAGAESRAGTAVFRAVDPSLDRPRALEFVDATPAEIDAAIDAAHDAFVLISQTPAAARAELLRRMAERLEAVADQLLPVTNAETALGLPRLTGELARTCNQMRSFARMLERGWHVDAIIDAAAGGTAAAVPDLRRMNVPLGPVAVFGASNFPLAFGVAGGDTASALAAGCPVVVKGNPSHPETSEICVRAMTEAVADCGFPSGTLSLVQGRGHDVGTRLVTHPKVAAVGFTGSEAGGRALFDAAAGRPVPIPVYAEMGSINPVLVTPSALEPDAAGLAAGLVDSLLLGNGQFCTKPGIVLIPAGADGDALVTAVSDLVSHRDPGFMLTPGIRDALRRQLNNTELIAGTGAVRRGRPADAGLAQQAAVVTVDGQLLLEHPELLVEHFGPVGLFVRYSTTAQLMALVQTLPGSLTATVHARSVEPDLRAAVDSLVGKVGRVIWNGYPTGVAVAGAMLHGGPYPASTASSHTSVGWTAVRRFQRPVCFQSFPDEMLPPELRDANPLGIVRRVNGRLTDQPLS